MVLSGLDVVSGASGSDLLGQYFAFCVHSTGVFQYFFLFKSLFLLKVWERMKATWVIMAALKHGNKGVMSQWGSYVRADCSKAKCGVEG